MKSLVFIVLLVLAGIAGYNFINKPVKKAEPTAVVEEVITSEIQEAPANKEEIISEEVTIETAGDENTITPSDMPEEAQQAMFTSMVEYNKCMMLNRPEYHQENARTEDLAGKTLEICEPKLDALKAVLAANNVNADLREGMVKTVRQRSTRKLMSAVMQSQAREIMAAESPTAKP